MRQAKNNVTIRFIAAFAVLFILALLFKPPYFLISPGETKATMSLIEYTEQDAEIGKQAEGVDQLFFTTILLSETNWWGVLQASLHPHQALVGKQQLLQGITLSEFSARSQLLMRQSTYQALEAAYTYLNLPYRKQAAAVYVTKHPRGNASQFFEADHIKAIEIGGQLSAITSTTQLVDHINRLSNKADKRYTLIVVTEGEERELELELPANQVFPINEQQLAEIYQLAGFINLEEITAKQTDKQVSFPSTHVGGPSAGLIMTISIINKLQDDVIQTPYKVAATGTIISTGEIGIIGSLEQKVVTVDKAQMDLFLVPRDQLEIAQRKAESINSAVTIVGVSTLAEAIEIINQFEK